MRTLPTAFVARSLRRAAILLAITAGAAQAQSGLLSNTATVTINATKQAALSIAINSGGTQTMSNLSDNAVNSFATPVNITTTWDINPSAASVALVGYFSSPTQALANGTDYIASSLVKGRIGTSGVFNPFSGAVVTGGASSVGVAGGTLSLFSQAITGANKKSSRTDDLYLQIDLTGQSVTAGTYTGTLNLRAITQ
ncbi:MAG: hypothetical protein U0164_13995 [Gemmatimonadaceae bacterium]